ncbi:MAG: site-specific integrase [Muribaculaceae bacterium]|nr:site-specific integrase [Muribaculaceae bacterium]
MIYSDVWTSASRFFMANTRFYLDERKSNGDKPVVLKIAIAQKGHSAFISLNAKILPCQWDTKKMRVVNHPEQMLMNVYINGIKQQVDRLILSLANDGTLSSMSATDIKAYISSQLYPEKAQAKEEAERRKKLFATRFLAFAESKKKSTREVYMHTYKRMEAFVGDKLQKLCFEDITKEWLTKFDVFMSTTSPSKNSRNIHLRNIRAVFNEALDDGITTFYPFRRFKIRPVATPKRNLKVKDLRLLWNYPCEPHANNYLDIFKLMFMLIGINCIDLCNLKEIRDGRIEFYRAKTNRLYSIKVEPEALEIIERHRGEKHLLDILDRWKSHKDFIAKMNRTLKRIGEVKRVGLGGKKIYKPLFPEISTYWARHSWATIAASLDIPRDTIAHALGHGNNTVTDIYIDFDQSKVDEANRKVINWVLYGKR